LWPLSRSSRPKQFLSLGGEYSLFQNTLLRCENTIFDERPIVIAANDHRFLVAEDLHALGKRADILLEPVARNSCAAIVAGCLQAISRDNDAIVLVLAADHAIRNMPGFVSSVKDAIDAAALGYLITFGVRPDHPATGYGYISPDHDRLVGNGFAVARFVEKPDAKTAASYLDKGYLWNSGNFMFRARDFLAEAQKLVPEILEAVSMAFEKKVCDLDFFRLEPEAFENSPSISVDYAIMEKTQKAAVFAVDHDWSDIGTWHSIWRNLPKDEKGNAVIGDGLVVDGEKNLVHSEKQLTTLVGVDDTIVVTTRDIVLVASQVHSEAVKQLVAKLEEEGREEATQALQIYRPWGNYELLDKGNGYQVKRIIIKPEGVLSLQTHKYRAEHWVVVQGCPEVTIDKMVKTLEPNQSIYIPLGSVHRLANRGSEPVVLIEVQTGSYLGEDDIIRLEDEYNRDSS